jgi:hypothetical protein
VQKATLERAGPEGYEWSRAEDRGRRSGEAEQLLDQLQMKKILLQVQMDLF